MSVLEGSWVEHGYDHGEGRHHACACRHAGSSLRGLGAGFGGPAAENHYPPSLEIEPVHLSIELALDLEAQTAVGTVTHTLTGNRAGARVLELDAVDFLDVKVKDLAGRALTHGYDGEKLWVRWEEPFAQGEKRQIAVSYRVAKPRSGLFFMKPTTEDPSKPYYAATDHETELARHWLPTIDLPNVRTTLEFKLTAKSEYAILANGYLVGEEANANGTKTAHWKLDQRCPSYILCFAVGDFIRADDGEFEGIPVAYFATKDFRPDDLKRSFGRTRDMLAWMTKRLGTKFPFPKYYQFALPAFGGAMENISLVSWSDTYVLDERIAPEGTWLVDQVNVHEMAHSYFGDLVVCRDFAHAWLKESWATYMETCWLEDKKGADEQQYDLYRNAYAYFEEADSSYNRPLVTRKFASSWQMYDRHLYPGGACRLHTIRRELGDEVFWKGVSDYLATNAQSAVETDDFRRALEKACGRSLQKLFDQWVFTAAYPDLKVTFSYDKEKAIGSFEVEQKQFNEAKGVPAFDLKVDLGWTVDGKTVTKEARLASARQTFHFPMAKEPEQVRFDPSWNSLHKLEFNPGDEKLRKQLSSATDVVGRILAAKVLGEGGKRANVRALLDAWKKEKFWGVKREIIAAIAKAGTEDAIQGLAAIVADEADAQVLDRVFAASGSFRDARLAEAIRARLTKGDLPPKASAAALTALGLQHEKASADFLRKMSERECRRYGYEPAAALHALGMSRSEDQAQFLIERSKPGKTGYRARRGAVAGMASLAPFVEKKWRAPLHERLIDLLRDPDAQMRQAAARGLAAARVTDGLPALSAYRATLSHQEAVGLDSLIASLRKGEGDHLADVDKRFEDLTDKLRKALARVQDLEDKMAPDAGKAETKTRELI